MRTRGRRRKRRRSHRVLDPTYPELSVARATLVFYSNKYISYIIQKYSYPFEKKLEIMAKKEGGGVASLPS